MAFTTSGEMFLDPNAIETAMWSSSGVSATDHGKPAYKAALNSFAETYLPGYKPKFIEKHAEVPASMAATDLDPSSVPRTENDAGFSLDPGRK